MKDESEQKLVSELKQGDQFTLLPGSGCPTKGELVVYEMRNDPRRAVSIEKGTTVFFSGSRLVLKL